MITNTHPVIQIYANVSDPPPPPDIKLRTQVHED